MSEKEIKQLSNESGLIILKSKESVAVTADRFEQLLKDRELNLFARINHAGNAVKVDLELRPTELFLFGNPVAGTILMREEQTAAIDLPQKTLIWEDHDGQVWLAYNDPNYIKQRHGLKDCDAVLEKISTLLAGLAKSATQ